MTERLFQYIWQFQHFNSRNLQTTQGSPVQVIKPGLYNTNQGPDFSNAQIKIGNTIWAGSVELHVNSSDWKLHNHSSDSNYNNVILHVVWNDDSGLELPFQTLELQNLISKLLLTRYEELMQSRNFIPCEKHFHEINEIVLTNWKERLVIERLQQKALSIEQFLKKNNQHWEETFWWMIARNFGMKINSDTFEQIARSLPISILGKHRNQLIQLEALLFGQAGLLEKEFEEDYPLMLRKEYLFLKKKYGLKSIHSTLYFLRMRPANFPTIRIAQLATLINQSQHLFAAIKEKTEFSEIADLFNVTPNDYWHYHYMLDEESLFKKKTLGKQMINNIMINTVIPVLYAYGYFNNNEFYKDKALRWMEQVPAEKNNITAGYHAMGAANKTACDSQAFIQLKNEYCDHKKCLQCSVGNTLLRAGNP